MTRATRFLTRSAILLSLVLVLQVFGSELSRGLGLSPWSVFVVGPAVAACLLVATAFAGPWAGIALALLAPLGAYATGSVTEPVFLLAVAVGNLILVLPFAVMDSSSEAHPPRVRLGSRALGILAGSVLSCAWLWGGVTLYVRWFAVEADVKAAMLYAYAWPQAVAAAAGGAVALLALLVLEKRR